MLIKFLKNCESVPVCDVEGKGLGEVQSLFVLMLPTLIALLVIRIWNYLLVRQLKTFLN